MYLIRIDAMHVLDLRGVIAIAAGSLYVHLITFYDPLGATQQARLDNLNERMRAFQRGQTDHHMPPLRLADLKLEGWSCLHGKLVKAANTRALVPWLLHLANTVLSQVGAFTSATRNVFQALSDIERIMYSADRFFTDEENDAYAEAFLKLGENWQFLRAESRRARIDAWQITPKVHISMHLPMQARMMNPRFVQVYGEESLVGRITRIWHAAANGPYANVIQPHTLSRYFCGLELRMTADLVVG